MKKVEHTIPASFAREDHLDWSEWGTTGLILFLASLFMVGLYWDTIQSMISVWSTSRTFAHGFLVLPAAGYFIWCYRPLWIHQVQAPSPVGLGSLVLLGGGWFIGFITDMLWLQQAAVVAMLPGLIWAILGIRIVRTIAWPLAFLFFMLPVGTSIEPWLQNFTAWFVQAGLRLAQIPHFSDNAHQIVITTGVWEVARDCGGLRYLLPGLALGAAFAMLIYQQPFRRLAFLALCAATLMVANGVRAYGVIIADYFGIADGTDHRVFSYTIYGLTIPLLFWIGLQWSDTGPTSSMEDRLVARQSGFDTRKIIVMGIAAVSILAIGRLSLSMWLWFSNR